MTTLKEYDFKTVLVEEVFLVDIDIKHVIHHVLFAVPTYLNYIKQYSNRLISLVLFGIDPIYILW